MAALRALGGLLTLLLVLSTFRKSTATKCEAQDILKAFQAAHGLLLRGDPDPDLVGTSIIRERLPRGSVDAMRFNGAHNDLVVDGGTLFPCGLSGVFSAKVTFRLERDGRHVLLSINRKQPNTRQSSGKPLLDLMLKRSGHNSKLRIRGTGVDLGGAPHLEIDLHRNIQLNRTHTLVFRIDRFSARARLDCSPWRIIGFPGLVPVSPEAVKVLSVRLGYRDRRSGSTPTTGDGAGSQLLKGVISDFTYFTDPAEASAQVCDLPESAGASQGARAPQGGGRALVSAGVPVKCNQGGKGLTWFNTVTKALLVCDGRRWMQPRNGGECSIEYIDSYQELDMANIVDLEPFRMHITDRLTAEQKRGPRTTDQYEPFLVASRLNYQQAAPRQCLLSIVYRWGREGGWYAYDHLPEGICNAGYTKAFVHDGVEYLAVLDRSKKPQNKLGELVIFVWQQTPNNHKRIVTEYRSGESRVYVTSQFSEQFDVFHIGERTFVGVANLRSGTRCALVTNDGDDCVYKAKTHVYEFTTHGGISDSRFLAETHGATKVKHIHAPEINEDFLFIANSMDKTTSWSSEGEVTVYKWSPAEDTFLFVQRIAAEGVTKLETFLLHGSAHVIFSSLVKQRVIGQNIMVEPLLTAPIYKYDTLQSRFVLVQSIQTNTSTGAKYISICGQPMLALTSEGMPDIANPASTSYLYSWKGILGFQPATPISLDKVSDVEHMEIDGAHYLMTASQHHAKARTLKIITS